MMRKQKSPCTISSFENSSVWQMSSTGGDNYENNFFQNVPYSHLLTFVSDDVSNPYEGTVFHYDYVGAGDPTAHNYFQNVDDTQITNPDFSYLTYDGSWNFDEPSAFIEQPVPDYPFALPIENSVENSAVEPFEQHILQYRVPTVTNYGAVALLLRHLIRVDIAADESVCVYNFPAQSVTALNLRGNKFYVKHPNGVVFHAGATIHAVTQNDRMVKISRRGITFSSSLPSLAYFVDESGTKTTTAKFVDLSKDLTMDVFYEGNSQSFEDLEQECYRMVAKESYREYQDGSEVWILGSTRIKQDKWGQVTISQNNGSTTISTSATTRRVTIESPSASVNIDCYMKNYLTVRKDSCLVTAGYCGLIAQNRSQKAGLDRNGRLVLF